jgi:hypothetical protein
VNDIALLEILYALQERCSKEEALTRGWRFAIRCLELVRSKLTPLAVAGLDAATRYWRDGDHTVDLDAPRVALENAENAIAHAHPASAPWTAVPMPSRSPC